MICVQLLSDLHAYVLVSFVVYSECSYSYFTSYRRWLTTIIAGRGDIYPWCWWRAAFHPHPNSTWSVKSTIISVSAHHRFSNRLLSQKIFNPTNKKEFKVRGVSTDTDTPDKLKHALASQYGDLLPQPDNIEVGYFIQCKKMSINNRLDLNDVWAMVAKGEKIILWCMGIAAAESAVGQRK